jgi:hypothetical protein
LVRIIEKKRIESICTHFYIIQVGVALIGGLIAFINRRGGCASRSKKQGNEPNGDKYMVDMNQNEFGSTAGAGIAAPLSPFENRRFVPSPQPIYAPSEPNNDYQEGYSQAGYSQGGYSQAGYSQDAYHSDGYGYYGYPQEYSQEYPQQQQQHQDAYMYHNEQPYVDPQSPYVDATSPTSPASPTVFAGTMSEASYQNAASKPNLKEYNKPNEV